MEKNTSFADLKTTLAPFLQDLESKRQEMKSEAIRKILFTGGIVIGVALIISFLAGAPQAGTALGFIIALIYAVYTCNTRGQLLNDWYKKEIVSRIVQSLVENGEYDPGGGIPEDIFLESDLFRRPDRYHSEDLIKGKIGQTWFRFAEVHAEEKRVTTNGKGQTQTTWVTIFKGFLFVADFHKDFSGRTVICRDSLFNFRGNRVKLENPDFERRFDVYSSDQVEARYLLSPSMMERIVALDEKFNKDITLSFNRSNILIALESSRNHFEAGLWNSITDTESLLWEYRAISSLVSIVEDLNLNVRIWTKE